MQPVPGNIGHNHFPKWSPDGKFLSYMSRGPLGRAQRSVITVLEMATGATRTIPQRLSWINDRSWSPDMQTIAALAGDLDGRSGLFLVDAQSGETRLVTTEASLMQVSWSLDGKSLFYRKSPGPLSSGTSLPAVSAKSSGASTSAA